MNDHLFRGCMYPARPCRCAEPPPEPSGYRPEELSAILGPPMIVNDPVRPDGSGRVSPEAQRMAEDWAREYLAKGCPVRTEGFRLREDWADFAPDPESFGGSDFPSLDGR